MANNRTKWIRKIPKPGSAAAEGLGEGHSLMPPVQRVVNSKIVTMNTGEKKVLYYSTFDTKKNFENLDEAWKYDEELRKSGERPNALKKKKFRLTEAPKTKQPPRYPTNYTFYHTKPENVLPLTKQGAHSISYAPFHHQFSQRVEERPLSEIVNEQIDPPEKFLEKVDKEAPESFDEFQKKRMENDYRLLYDRVNLLTTEIENEKPPPLKEGEEENIEFISNRKRRREEAQEITLRLTQMDPYTVYSKGAKLKKKTLNHKGERKEDDFEKSFDPLTKFDNEEGYSEFKDKRKKLWEPYTKPTTSTEVKKEEKPFHFDFDPEKLDFGIPKSSSSSKTSDKFSLNFILNPETPKEKDSFPPFQFPSIPTKKDSTNEEDKMDI